MRSAAIFFILCSPLIAQVSGVSGIVLDATTRQPVAGAHLTLFGVPTEGSPVVEDAYGAISKADGHYSIGNMKAGVYAVTVLRNGMVQVPVKGKEASETYRVLVKAGEATEFPVEMAPHAVITGRVTDEYGEPVRQVQMQAVAVGASGGAASRGLYALTDDRGMFRLVGAPGKYRVKATLNRQPQMMGMAPEVRTDGTLPAVYGTTWFPGSESEERGAIVEVPAGREATGVDVRLVQQSSRTVSGILTGLPEKTARAVLYLFPVGGDIQTQFQGIRNAISAPDGKFAFSGVAPGSYRVSSMTFGGNDSSTAMRGTSADVRVDNADVTDVRVTLLPGQEMGGSLEILGAAPPGKPDEKTFVSLEPLSQIDRSYGSPMVSGEVDRQGAFKLAGVFPGKFKVKVDPLPENAYVKSVKVDGAEATDLMIDLSRGVRNSTLKVTVSRNGAQVEATLSGADGKPSGAAIAMVVLAANPEEIGYDTLKRNSGPTYTFKGVRPGKYRLIAVDAFQVQQDLLADMKALFAKAPEIEVREGDRLKRDVPLLAKEKPDAR